MPTAMPEPPFSKRFGTRAGRSVGSSSEPSKFGAQSTVARTELVEQQVRVAREPRLGVAHRGKGFRIVGRAPVALPVDERIAVREILRHVHHGLVARGIAVRMEFADDVADRARRLLVLRARGEAELAHGVDDAPLHRLQAVAQTRQRAIQDHVHRVIEIGALGEGS